MTKTVLWIDDSAEERAAAASMLAGVEGVVPEFASSSVEACRILETQGVDAIVTDILRRNPDRSVAKDDGYQFFQEYIRPTFPTMPVIFHMKNLPSSFETGRLKIFCVIRQSRK